MERYYKTVESPVGRLILISGAKGLSGVHWKTPDTTQESVKDCLQKDDHPILLEAEKQLSEYFTKQRKNFSFDLAFEGTAFQVQVWQALLTIPFGETRTYGEIAKQIGSPDAVRAVGGAANKNPIAIIAPCHRVIGATGKLIGFGGGLSNKKFLLDFEATHKQLSIWNPDKTT